jgi:hypothetical protein
MIKKTENCLYCGEKMESKTAKKKFCCDLHRVYWNREKKISQLVTGDKSDDELLPPSKELIKSISESVLFKPRNENVPPMPIKEKGEDSLLFAARKNEWKLKYTQK